MKNLKNFAKILLLFQVYMFYIFSDEEMVIKLGTGTDLLPIFISSEKDTGDSYILDLERILKFDFSHNGMTYIVEPSKQLLELDLETPYEYKGDLSQWLKQNVYYLIKIRVKDQKLSARLFLINSNKIKTIENLPLSGELNQDRRTVHQLSDSLFHSLFAKNGIASTQILYAVKTKDLSNKWVSLIYESDYDGANERMLTKSNEYAISPTYIPQKLGFKSPGYLYVSYKSGQPKIYFGSFSNNPPQRLSMLKGNQLLPAISKQRDKIAFISDVLGNPDLFLQEMDPEKGPIGKPRQIYSAPRAAQGSPTFSADGNEIAFVSNKDGSPRIYIMEIPKPNVELKNIKIKLATKNNRENTAPSWSPDGTKIAYCAQTKGIRQIWIYDVATKIEKQLTIGEKNKENPTWAPDSLHLIYNTSDAKDSELYLINLNQKEAVKISSGAGEKYFPSWEI